MDELFRIHQLDDEYDMVVLQFTTSHRIWFWHQRHLYGQAIALSLEPILGKAVEVDCRIVYWRHITVKLVYPFAQVEKSRLAATKRPRSRPRLYSRLGKINPLTPQPVNAKGQTLELLPISWFEQWQQTVRTACINGAATYFLATIISTSLAAWITNQWTNAWTVFVGLACAIIYLLRSTEPNTTERLRLASLWFCPGSVAVAAYLYYIRQIEGVAYPQIISIVLMAGVTIWSALSPYYHQRPA